MKLLLPFETAYPQMCVPKGCQVAREEYPLVSGNALVIEIQPDEAQVAFLLHYPVAAALGASRSRRSTLELLLHNGEIFWPHGGSLYAPILDDYEGQRTFRYEDAAEWCVGIGRNRDLLKVVPKGKKISRTEIESRVAFPNGASEAIARVQRALSRNYIVCRGRLYVRGGFPIYVQWKKGSRRTMVVTSSGCDRSVDGREDLYMQPASFECYESQQALYEGRFWIPDEEEEARSRLTKSQTACPSIEVCIPELVEDSRRDVQVDALFREVNRLLSYILYYARIAIRGENSLYSNSWKFHDEIRRNFEDAFRPKADSYATTKARSEALRSLLSCGPVFPKRGRTPASIACLAAFRDLERRHPPERISAEDLSALEDVGLSP
jgi:hypothetical protein